MQLGCRLSETEAAACIVWLVHNTSSELALRRHVLGRRNWLFTLWVSLAGQLPPAPHRAAELPARPFVPAAAALARLAGPALQLAPLFWSQTLHQRRTQQRLRENLLRGALLSELP